MALSTGSVGAQVVQWGDGAAYQGLQFAKVGLILKARSVFTLSVPAQMRGAMKIGWSNRGYTLADELEIPGCNPHQANGDWLVYPGGFWLKEPGCIPLEVTTGQTNLTIYIPIGKPCP